jgi:two-component system, NarL family, nitrate/nitrite response regulator NarL
VRLALCDGDVLFMEALAWSLSHRGHQIACCWGCAAEARAGIGDVQADALIADHRYLGANGPGLIRELTAARPLLPVVMFTADPGQRLLAEVLESGAAGLVLKTEDLGELERVVVLSCAHAARPELAGLRRHCSPQASSLRAHDRHFASLTPREREVLQRVMTGQDTAAIASSLGMGVGTVRVHLGRIFTKIGVHSRLELVAQAMQAEFV